MRKTLLFIIGSVALSPLYAEPRPTITPQEILSRAIENHPDIQRAKAKAARGKALSQASAQRPNPEIDAESTFSDDQDRIEAAYLHTFELGGKRAHRIQAARAEGEGLAANLRRTQEEVALQTVVNLYRLSHIQRELDAAEEALETFGTILKQYRARAHLTPEQEVSLNVFLLARGDYELRKTALIQERGSIQAYFDVATGENFQTVLAAIPPRKDSWPDIGPIRLSTAAAVLQEAASAVGLSRANFNIAQSEAWPDLKAGPKAEFESGSGESNTGFGAALSLSLPLYQRNQGRRAIAEIEMKLSRTDLGLREKELQAELERLRRTYTLAVEALQKTPSIDQMETKHRAMESLFERGLVSAPLVIEAHRQMTDFTEDQNAQELHAIEALWSIYRLEGRILQEAL